MPVVSVVVPCWNGGRFVDGLLDSLAAQTLRDFETIIIDDGSTEADTLRKLAALDGSIRVVRQENRGLSAARNAGFEVAAAELVLPLDCDDRIEPAFLAETVAALEAAPDAGFAFTHAWLHGLRNGALARQCNEFDQLFLNQLPYCMLMRKKAWAAIGGYDESMRFGYEDWEFNIRLVTQGWRGIEIERPLFVYHERDDGMLLGGSARRHGKLWQQIRIKHAALYRAGNLARTWRKSRRANRKMALPVALALLGLAKAMPTPWFDRLFFTLLAVTQRRRDPGQVAAGKPDRERAVA
jgi:glycosyltransferase involved in cell wall biosynthesis